MKPKDFLPKNVSSTATAFVPDKLLIEVHRVAAGLLTGAANARITEAQLVDVLTAIGSDELKMAVIEEWTRRKLTLEEAKSKGVELLKDLGVKK